MDDNALIAELTASYAQQLDWYRRLNTDAQKILGKLVMARGDVSPVMGAIAEKQKLLERIGNERGRINDRVKLWQERKSAITPGRETEKLNDILSTTETILREFLENEERIQKYLRHTIEKSAGKNSA
jgi:hypothetical protein